MTRDPWTSGDLAQWRKVTRLAGDALAGPQDSVMRELAAACRTARKACFPTARQADHAPLADFLALAGLYARGTSAERRALQCDLRKGLDFAAAIVGRPAEPATPSPATAPAQPYYLRD